MTISIEKRPPDFPWPALSRGGCYKNVEETHSPGLRDILRWKLGFGPKEEVAPTPPDYVPPSKPLDQRAIAAPDPDTLTATWLGHATFLLQLAGMNLLLDPILGAYCAPVPFERFRRRSPAVRPQDLPPPTAVLVSHNHYDHLDLPTLRCVSRETPVLCPSGNAPFLAKAGFTSITELSWGDAARIGDLRVTAVPARHGSARSGFDRNRALWCGWRIASRNRSIHFVGDSGYSKVFREMGGYFGPPDLALIPIGAYRPRWFMTPVHMNPEEAVQTHRDLEARLSVAMHWGTYSLADESLDEPPRLLTESLRRAAVSEDSFRVLAINETLVL